MAMPSVYANPASHYVVILTKAANQRRLPPLDLCVFGWDMKDGILVLAISHALRIPFTECSNIDSLSKLKCDMEVIWKCSLIMAICQRVQRNFHLDTYIKYPKCLEPILSLLDSYFHLSLQVTSNCFFSRLHVDHILLQTYWYFDQATIVIASKGRLKLFNGCVYFWNMRFSIR